VVQQRLLEIAIREFGAKGLEGASTRGIAAAAGTAMSSITYHYGGKEGLYLAAADYIAEQMGKHMAPALALRADFDPASPEGARAIIKAVLSKLIDKMVDDESATWALFIIREQTNPTEAFERIYGGMMGRTLEKLADLVCVASGNREDYVARIATITLIGQVIALRASRAAVLKLLERPSIDEAVVSALKTRIFANTDAILDRLISERQDLR
jgi:AcrR family transcriptional regulator